MTFVIVPDCLSAEIHAAIDLALAGRPCDDQSREIIYCQVLAHYGEHGAIPSFTLTPQESIR